MLKRGLLALSVLLAVVLLAGCKDAGSSSAPDGSKPYVAIISKGFQHQFWQAVKMGAEKAALEENVSITFEGPESEAQVDKQLEMLEAALGKNPAAIAFAALDSKAAVSLLEKAQKASIPVVGFDSGVDSDIPVATAATDNKNAAAFAADKMAEFIGGAGEVAIIANDPTGRTNVDRRDGFLERIKSKYPKIKVVDVQYGGDQLKATDVAKAMIQAHPNLKGIFGANEGCAVGALNGVEETKMVGKIVVIGYDAGKRQKDGVRDGKISGSITQDPVGIGYKAVKACAAAIKGEKVEKNIDTGFKWYDKTNVDSEEMKPLLYE